MGALIATDVSVCKIKDRIYVPYKYSTILRRYSKYFGALSICARCITDECNINGYDDITEIVHQVIPVTLSGSLLGKHKNSMCVAIKDCDIVVSRCPSLCGYRAADYAVRLDKPLFFEAMGCAWDTYWNHSMKGKLLAPYMYLKMKSVAKKANYALYVTDKALQNRYPCKCKSVGASNVLLTEISSLDGRKDSDEKEILTLMTTAAVDVKYKGQQYVIEAMAKLKKMGVKIKYYIVGEGDSGYLKEYTKQKKLEDCVELTGRLQLNSVLKMLDQIDIYIQPSLSEGLPRAVIEAMSRGCVCIVTDTLGGTELADDMFLIRKKNVDDIVQKILLFRNASAEEKKSYREYSIRTASKYLTRVLDEKRNKYFTYVQGSLDGKH